MADFIDQRVREAFMEFRDEARGEILAPGPRAARRTANRRRGIGAAVATCGLAAVLVGAWVALRPPAAPAPAASEPASPAPATYDESVSAAFARAQFGSYDPAWATVPTSPIWWGPTGIAAVERTFRYPGAPPGVGITMAMACAGTGSVTVHFQTVDQSAEIPVSCGEDGLAEYALINPLTPEATLGAIEVTVQGDERVTPDGAFVVIMTDPRSLAAQALLGPPPSEESIVGTGTTYNPFGSGGTSSRSVGPGRYRLTLVCIGDPVPEVEPQIRVQMFIGAGDLVGQHAACPSEGGRIELEVSSQSAQDLEVSIRQTGSFGYAYHIVRTEAT